jgi:hypothetical protein
VFLSFAFVIHTSSTFLHNPTQTCVTVISDSFQIKRVKKVELNVQAYTFTLMSEKKSFEDNNKNNNAKADRRNSTRRVEYSKRAFYTKHTPTRRKEVKGFLLLGRPERTEPFRSHQESSTLLIHERVSFSIPNLNVKYCRVWYTSLLILLLPNSQCDGYYLDQLVRSRRDLCLFCSPKNVFGTLKNRTNRPKPKPLQARGSFLLFPFIHSVS